MAKHMSCRRSICHPFSTFKLYVPRGSKPSNFTPKNPKAQALKLNAGDPLVFPWDESMRFNDVFGMRHAGFVGSLKIGIHRAIEVPVSQPTYRDDWGILVKTKSTTASAERWSSET